MAELAKVLGLPSLTFYGTGLILGAGIYSIIGAAAGEAGRGLWLAFALAAGVAALSALSYAELVSMFPKAGAEYNFVREAFPRPRVAAGATGLVLAASATASAATVGVAFGGYLRIFFDVPVWMSAVGLLVFATLFNIVGVRESAWANIAMTLLEIGGLLLVVWVGARGPGLDEGMGLAPLGGLVAGAGLVFFAFLGFEDVANLAEESKRPTKDPPRAILLSIGIAVLLYVLVSLAAVALLPPDELAASDSPLSAAVEGDPAWAATAIGAIALFATANTALVSMIAASRLVFAVGRGGDAPSVLAMILPNRRTPWVAGLVVFAGGLLLLPLGGVGLLGAVASLAALTAFIIVDACVVRLRYTQPDAERPFRVRWSIGKVPVLPIVGALGALGFATQFEVEAYWIGAGAVAVIAAILTLGRATSS